MARINPIASPMRLSSTVIGVYLLTFPLEREDNALTIPSLFFSVEIVDLFKAVPIASND